ncbi:hypothetical protein HPB47_000647, partial [Ixodes persulcatus]
PVRARQLPSNIELYAQSYRIPTVRSIRVLGLRIQAGGNNSEMIASLKATEYQIRRLISRIAGRNYGMKEKNLVRLVRAFVVSRLAYVLPFLRLGLTGTNKLNSLGIPDTTSNEKLAALGLHNTVEDIIEAQRVSQLERLTKSATGRHILASLGIRYERQTGEKADVPRRVREAVVIPNIPKHMHPTHHAERRAARVKALQKRLSIAEGILYTVAARAGGGAMVATAVKQQGETGSFPSPSLLNKWYPDKYKPNCKLCGGHANLRHMVWECSRIDRKSHPLLEKIDNQES